MLPKHLNLWGPSTPLISSSQSALGRKGLNFLPTKYGPNPKSDQTPKDLMEVRCFLDFPPTKKNTGGAHETRWNLPAPSWAPRSAARRAPGPERRGRRRRGSRPRPRGAGDQGIRGPGGRAVEGQPRRSLTKEWRWGKK